MNQLITGGIFALILAGILGLWFIPVLTRLKFGQEIREEGPKWHAKKSGTPTMGGLIFITAIVISCLLCYLLGMQIGIEIVMLLAISLIDGVIGFIDDYIKVILKRNLGLTAKQKFFNRKTHHRFS